MVGLFVACWLGQASIEPCGHLEPIIQPHPLPLYTRYLGTANTDGLDGVPLLVCI